MQDAKRRAIIFAVVSLVLAMLAGILFMQRVSAVEAQLGNEVTVFVAKSDIQPRQPLKPEQFESVQVPQKFVQQSTVTNLQAIGNQGGIEEYVTIVPLKQGDVLNSNLLKPAKEMGTNGDKRLVYVPSSDRIVFDQPLDAQDRADIIVSWGGSNGSKRTVIFDTDVLVAATSGDEGKFAGVWLEMSLEEAKRFIDAMNFARSVRILKAPQQKDEKKVSVNQEVPDKVEDPDQQKQGEQSPTNGEGNNSLPSNLDEQQLDLD